MDKDDQIIVGWWESRALDGARVGDWAPLIEYLESGWPMTMDVRKVLAKILKSEMKKPNNRAPKEKTAWKHRSIASAIATLKFEGVPATRIIAQVADSHKVSGRTVYNVKKEYSAFIQKFIEDLKKVP